MPSQNKRKFQKEKESIFDSNKDDFLLPIDEGNEDQGIDEGDENQVIECDSEWEDVESEDEHQEVTSDSDYVGSSHGGTIKSLKKKNTRNKSKRRTTVITGKVARRKATQNSIQTTTTTQEVSKNIIDLDGDDISDEEDLRNTVGNIPVNWYDEFDHIGYGLDGLRLRKPNKGDSLDQFLQKVEGHDFGRLIYDKQTGQDIKLTDDDVKLVKRLMKHRVPSSNYNMYAPFLDLYSHEVMEMPVNAVPASKKSFIPSKFERQKVARLALLIRKGLYQQRIKKKKGPKEYYDLWQTRSGNEPPMRGLKNPIMSPLEIPPSHGESYNPPPEYLIVNPNKVQEDGTVKKLNVHPFAKMWRKFPCVRDIPSYRLTIKERLSRLTKLYLAHRKRTKWTRSTSKSLLPKLPNKKDLRPYPTMLGDSFVGHKSIVRSISIHPCGKYLASGSDDQTVKVWEVSTGRCLQTFTMNHMIQKVAWNPNPNLFLLAIVVNRALVMLNPETYLTDKVVVRQTNAIFKEEVDQGDYIAPTRVEGVVTWRKPTPAEWALGFRVVLDHFQEVKEVVWHAQGDYFVSVMPQGLRRSVVMHQLSRWRSQLPFQGNKGRVQVCSFHPKEPLFFIANQTSVKLYNLKTQKLFKKVRANCRWVSCLAVHPGGGHFITGGYDRRVNWIEMECSSRPHLMKYHTGAVRAVKYHRKYPLFATASDDRKLYVVHGSVFDDWVKDPQIVLLKQLTGHSFVQDYYILDLEWHPFEPYLFSAGADGTINLWH